MEKRNKSMVEEQKDLYRNERKAIEEEEELEKRLDTASAVMDSLEGRRTPSAPPKNGKTAEAPLPNDAVCMDGIGESITDKDWPSSAAAKEDSPSIAEFGRFAH